MPSLRDCIGKAAKLISPGDAEAMHGRAKQYIADGHSVADAERMAVEFAKSEADTRLDSIYKQAGVDRKKTSATEPVSKTDKPKPEKENPTNAIPKQSPSEVSVRETPGSGEGVRRENPVSEKAAGAREETVSNEKSVQAHEIKSPKDAAPVSAHITETTHAEVKGEKINKDWTAFDKESGTLGVPRAEMPQIKSEHRGAMVNFLKARGIAAKPVMVRPEQLKPTQAEFSPAKVQVAREHQGSERPILISSDGHLVDGHHQWMAGLKDDPSTPMPAIKLEAPIDKVLAEVKEFPSAETRMGVAAKVAPKEPSISGPATKPLSERAIEALQKAKIDTKGKVFDAAQGTYVAAHNAAIDLAILAVRAGRAVGEAVQLAVARFKAKHPGHTAEEVARLENDIRSAVGEPKEASSAAGPAEAAPRVPVEGKSPNAPNRIRKLISDTMAKGDVEKALTYTRDAVDNKADAYARENSNVVSNEINRSFPEADRTTAREALAFAIESGGNEAKLKEMEAKISGSDKASDAWKDRALSAITFAKTNLAKLNSAITKYNELTDSQVTQERASGIDTLKRENYVMHRQDIDESLGHSLLGAGAGQSTGFRKNRVHETFADSIAAGIDPKSLDAVDLLNSRLSNGQKMINKSAWVEGLKGYTDPVSKQPIATEVKYTARPDGTQYAEAPLGYNVEHVGNTAIAVMKGYEGVFSALNDPSWWGKSGVRRAAQNLNAFGKSLNLLFDTFHLGRLSAWNAVTRLNAFGALGGGVEAPNPLSHKRGALLLDQTPGELLRISKEEGRSAEDIGKLLAQKQKLSMALETGANFGKVADALHDEAVVHKLPIVGKFNKWLFGQFQRGAMSEIWLMEYDRQRAMSGNKGLTNMDVARNVSREVNTRFGNLGRQGVLRSETARDIARMVVLAPQWNEGLVRSEVGAVTGAAKSAMTAAQGKGIATSMLTRSLATMVIGQFVANQIINQYTRDKFTWENPEEGVGAKLSAWIPDKIGKGPGFFLHPAGIGAEITHLLTSRYEKTSDFRESLGALGRSRLSAVARPLATFAFKTDALGRTLRPDDLYKEVAKDAVPLPIPSSSVAGVVKSAASGEKSETFPGQFQKQLMSTFGVKTDQAPTNSARISALAKDFNTHHGIKPSGEFYAGDYTDLATALKVGNKSRASDFLADLLAKHSPEEVVKHFDRQVNAPFTGNSKRERDFIATLPTAQRQVYVRAVKERTELRDAAKKALREYLQKHRVEGADKALAAMRATN
jgi:hypothetical protein